MALLRIVGFIVRLLWALLVGMERRVLWYGDQKRARGPLVCSRWGARQMPFLPACSPRPLRAVKWLGREDR